MKLWSIAIVVFGLMWANLSLACTYCVDEQTVCVRYEDVCTSYSEQCTNYETVCTNYQDYCTSYDYYCDAYDDNGDCISYSEQCVSWDSYCTNYAQQCTSWQTVCDSYQSQCAEYQNVCNQYMYGDYVTVTGSVISEQTGNPVNKATVTLNSTDSSSTNTAGRYSNTTFVEDDYLGRLNVNVCSAHYSSQATVCSNVYRYDTCSQPTITQDFEIDMLDLLSPTSMTVDSTSHSSLTVNWSSSFGSNGSSNILWSSSNKAGFMVAWAAGNFAPDCRTGVNIGNAYSYVINGLTQLTNYTISVCSYDSDGNTSIETVESQITKRAPPPSPTNIILNALSTSEISSAWSSGGGSSTGFKVNIAQGSSAPNCVTGIDVANLTTRSFTSLLMGTRYTFSVCAYDAYGNYSLPLTATKFTKYSPPNAPTNLVLNAVSHTQISSNWSAGGGTTSGYFFNYALGSTPPSCGTTNLGNVLSRNTTGLVAETLYSFSVCGYNPDGLVSSALTGSMITKKVPPPAPTALVLTALSPYSIQVGWTSAGGSTASFTVAHTTSGTANCASGVDVGLVNSYVIPNLQSITTYNISVCSKNDQATHSTPLTGSKQTLRAPPPSPTNLQALSYSTTELRLSWISGLGSTLGFKIKKTTGAVAGDCKTGTALGHALSYNSGGLTANTQYTYALCAYDAFGLYSTQVNVTQTTKRNPPPKPTSLALTAISDTLIRATWVNGGGSTLGYFVNWQLGTTAPNCATGVNNNAQRTIDITGLQPYTIYSVAVCAYDAYGNNSSQSSTYKRTLRTPPPAPINFIATDLTRTSIRLNWASGGGTTHKFRVARATGTAIPNCRVGSLVGNVLTYLSSSLAANTTYTFGICSYDIYGTYSNQVNITATTLRNPPPSPTKFAITALSDTELKASWTSGAGSTAGYFVNWQAGTTAPSCSAGSDNGALTNFSLSGLLPFSTYSISVCSYDGYGNNSTPVATYKATLRTPPPAPVNFTGIPAPAAPTTSIRLNWLSGGDPLLKYKIARAAGTTIPNCKIGTALTTLTYASTGLAANTTYTFGICAYDAFTTYSAQVNVTVTTQRNPPPASGTPTLTTPAANQILAKWTSAAGSTTGFKVNIAQGTTAASCQAGEDVGLVLNKNFTNLIANTTYTVSICSYDAYGNYGTQKIASKLTLP